MVNNTPHLSCWFPLIRWAEIWFPLKPGCAVGPVKWSFLDDAFIFFITNLIYMLRDKLEVLLANHKSWKWDKHEHVTVFQDRKSQEALPKLSFFFFAKSFFTLRDVDVLLWLHTINVLAPKRRVLKNILAPRKALWPKFDSSKETSICLFQTVIQREVARASFFNQNIVKQSQLCA